MDPIDLCDIDLMAFWSKYHRPTRENAEALLGDHRKGYIGIVENLANYACNLSVAQRCLGEQDQSGLEIYLYNANLCFERLPADVQFRVKVPSWVKKQSSEGKE